MEWKQGNLFFWYQTYLRTVAARLRAQESLTMEARAKSIPIPKAKAAAGKAKAKAKAKAKSEASPKAVLKRGARAPKE